MSRAALRHALTRLRRGARSGAQASELKVLALAVALAAAVASGVGLFTDRVQRAVATSAGDALGADAVIESRDPLPEATRAQLQALGVNSVAKVEFPSVVARADDASAPARDAAADDATQLASIKAVAPGYPLRGALKLSAAPFAPAQAAPGVPARGEAWVDPKLWNDFALQHAGKLQVGTLNLKATRVIAEEPGRGGAFADFAPELLMNLDDLPASGLVGPGSRVQYSELLAGSVAQLAAVRALELPRGARFVTPQEARPELKAALKRARQFLDIAVLATLLLAAAAVSLAARQHGARLRDEVALLKTLGARRSFLVQSLGLQILLLGLAAGGFGLALGAVAQALIGRIVAPLLNVELPMPDLRPLAFTLAVVVLMLAGFALPPVFAALKTLPLRVLQRAQVPARFSRVGGLAALAAVAALLWLQAGDAQLAVYVAIGALLTVAVLGLLAWLLVRLLAPLRRRSGVAWRFGLGNLARRGPATVAQIVALGVALLALMLVTLVRQDLLAIWRGRLPPETPNQFLIGIQPAQRASLARFFVEHGRAAPDLLPMVRAHLTAINDRPVSAENFDDAQTRRWINREFNLSWTDRFGPDNEVVAGAFWTAADRGRPWLSVEQDAAKRLGLKLGDRLSFDIAGQSITLTVHDLRKVHWDSFKPNFFLMAPPGVLEAPASSERAAAPVQWIGSFYLPRGAPDSQAWLRELVRRFPNVTVFDIDAALAEVRGIVDRVVRALELVLLSTLAAGVVVMLAVIEGARAERVRETGVLRALGASSRVILQGLVAEYAVLGPVAALAAQAIAWVLAVKVFELDYGPRPLWLLAGALAGAVVVTLTGWLGLRATLATSPREVLAANS